MPTEFSVANDDIMKVSSDMLLLKHAGDFYAADESVAALLLNTQRCSREELQLLPDQHVIIDTRGAMGPKRVMFLGTAGIGQFGYAEMQHFASLAIEILSQQDFTVRKLTTTIHGAGYGMDAEESMLSLVQGFETTLAAHDQLKISEICFVEHGARRARLLATALLGRLTSVARRSPQDTGKAIGTGFFEFAGSNPHIDPILATPSIGSTNKSKASGVRCHVFSEDFEDVYEYGIYTPVRNCGLICEKTSESAFTGDILRRIQERFETAEVVVTDLTGGRPNVYLEVGYA